MDLKRELKRLKKNGDAPEWMTIAGYTTLSKGYMLEGETPRMMYRRVASAAARQLNFKDQEENFFDIMWKNFLCPASPVLSNLGTDRGLPISCYTIDLGDSIDEITKGLHEIAMLSKNGGGVGINMNRIRARGSNIQGGKNGKSEGIIPFCKMYDSAILGVSQGSTRRGAASVNLDIEHGDWSEFIRMRRPEGDVNRQCAYLHHCTQIKDEFMHKIVAGEVEARYKWVELMRARMETGESYIMYSDTVNKANPEAYRNNKLEVSATNICSEITLHTDSEHSFICCLSSLNLERYDEWKDTDTVFTSILFLNAVLEEFIVKAEYLPGFDKVVASAKKGRALGLGALGWHSLLQKRDLPFASFDSMMLNSEIFKNIQDESLRASKFVQDITGEEPEWCKGTGLFNTHLIAIAPTRSNSIISGDISPGIEPIIANSYTDKSAKGTFFRRNKYLEVVLEKYGKNTDKVWKDISREDGSVQHLSFLTDHEKKVFLTAYEINQKDIIAQAAQRQKFICQAQSLNLFFDVDVDPKTFSDVHILAWELGVKTLYYCRSKAGIKADSSNRDECSSCEG